MPHTCVRSVEPPFLLYFCLITDVCPHLHPQAKPLKYNVALPPAILSRFDLMHVMIDETNEATDARIAQHIISLHRFQVGGCLVLLFLVCACVCVCVCV